LLGGHANAPVPPPLPPPRLQLHGGVCFTWPSLCLVQALANTQAYLPVMSVVILLVFNFCAGNVATCLSLLRTHGSWQIDALHAHIQCGAEQRSREHVFYVFQISKNLDFFSEMTCQKVTSRYRNEFTYFAQ